MNKVQQLLAARDDGSSKFTPEEIMSKTLKEVSEAIRAIFETNPTIHIIGVSGHSPHFNDGDPCRWGINSQVDWLGELSYNSDFGREISDLKMSHYNNEGPPPSVEEVLASKYVKYMTRRPPNFQKIKDQSDYTSLREALSLLYTYSKEFEILDAEHNGTCWVFIRKQEENVMGRLPSADFTIETTHYEHD